MRLPQWTTVLRRVLAVVLTAAGVVAAPPPAARAVAPWVSQPMGTAGLAAGR
jgi:hypothetical protein